MTYKIDTASANPEEFLSTQHEIAGEICTFIRPLPTYFSWTPETLHFRSVIVNSEGILVSPSYKKFFNFEEKPAIDPFTEDFSKVNIVEKLDGSTLIVSRYKGYTFFRTRGTVDARVTMSNGDEIEYFRNEKYKSFFDKFEEDETRDSTLLFEWVSPRNRIVLNYGQEPDLILTNIIDHNNYSHMKQADLDLIGSAYNIPRPKIFKFPSSKEMVKDIAILEGYEGVCVYYNDDQNIRKVKAVQYLKLHAFKSQLSLKALAELIYHFNLPADEGTFMEIIEREYDFECAVAAKPIVVELWKLLENFKVDIESVQTFTEANTSLEQKEFALKILDTYKNKPYLTSYGFSMRRDAFKMKDTQKAFLSLLTLDV